MSDLVLVGTVALDYWLGGVVALLVTGYLLYALVRPERF